MSISIVLEEIKTSPSSIIPVLSILHNEKQQLDQISKSDLTHLISRTLQLCRSPNIYNKWCGISIINVLSDNYIILANEGANFMTMLLTILESFNHTIDVIILQTCIESLNKLIRVIRDKPALTREILTPKLSSIISLYLKNLPYAPDLCIKSLYQIIKYHPTTFRPFANKFGEKLYALMQNGGFCEFPTHLQKSICKALAILPTVEKNEPETKWATDVDDIIAEIKGVVEIYDEFLNFSDDSELKRLLHKLPQSSKNKVFTSLEIDLNQPKTLLQINNRVEILTKLLATYLTEGIASVKVPLGKVFLLAETICSINTRYLSFKSDIRDNEIRGLIKTTLYKNYRNILGLLKRLLVFKGALIPHFPALWSSLAYMVPLSKSGKVSSSDVLNNEALFMDLLSCISEYIQLVGVVSDNSLFVSFVDVALVLSGPKANDFVRNKEQPTAAAAATTTSQSKKSKKKNVSSASLSDILSHQHLFTRSRSSHLLHVVRTFFDQIIKRSELPPTQHYKVVKFVIQECIEAAAGNYESTVPDSFRSLLRSAVLNPGYDKHNILPIVSSIIPEDELLSVFNNPRLPPLPKHVSSAKEQEEDEQAFDLDNVSDPEVDHAPMNTKESAIMKLLDEQREQSREETEIRSKQPSNVSDFSVKRVIDDTAEETLDGKKRKVETVQEDFSFKPETLETVSAPIEEEDSRVSSGATELRAATTATTTTTSTVEDNADGSDFEMPEINMEEDSDDDEDDE
ncbi:RIX1 [Candida margitis]|uniref:RIX1 n=1 Tax=Candida margitis TaxID=1775924 RepID=UPI002226D186|nr:RIX1 [Candida margitis]KAI5964970.1 RIX1 [Candida margitis]